ncbi:MAG: energy transducer TonB [Candidatus Aminicenantia bacterium]
MNIYHQEDYRVFKLSIAFSVIAHILLFIAVFLSPSFSKSSSKGMIHYVSLISLPGGGKEVSSLSSKGTSLKDLTKFQPKKSESKIRYPEKEPKKKPTPRKKKETVVSKSKQEVKTTYQKGELTTAISRKGSGVGLGIGEGEGGISGFPFTYYILLVRDKVSANWYTSLVSPGLTGSFRTVVYFKILRDGQISELKIEENSGVRSLDLSALRAVQSAAPFPSLPYGFEGEYLGIHFIFEHSK